MMIRKLAFILIPLSFYFSQSHQKTVLKDDMQEHFYYIQLSLYNFVRFESTIFI